MVHSREQMIQEADDNLSGDSKMNPWTPWTIKKEEASPLFGEQTMEEAYESLPEELKIDLRLQWRMERAEKEAEECCRRDISALKIRPI